MHPCRLEQRRHDRTWSPERTPPTTLSAILALVFIALFGMAQQHSGYAGLFERLAVSTEPVWEVLLLARLWSGAKGMRVL
jgi:hypothetical protein